MGFVPCREHGTGPALPLHASASPRQTNKKNATEIKSNRASGGLPGEAIRKRGLGEVTPSPGYKAYGRKCLQRLNLKGGPFYKH